MLIFLSGFCSATHKILTLPPICTLYRLLCNSSKEKSVSQELPISERYISYLENCPDINSLRKLHACSITFGLENQIYLGSKLLNCYASFDCLAESRWIFSKIINRNLSLWNSILVGYFRSGHFDEVLRLYLNLKEQNINVDSSTLTFSLKSCIELGIIEFGRAIHVDAFKFGKDTDGFVGSSLIGLYSKYGDIEDAREVFEEIFDRDVVAYTAMVTGYAQISDRRAYEAFRIVGCMKKDGLDPNRVTLVSLLKVAAQLEVIQEGRTVHGYAIRRHFDCFDEVLETSLLDMYIKCGASDVATSIFIRMNRRSVASWNALIAGHVQIGRSSKALEIFYQMVQANFFPDLITLANGLLGCADLRCLVQGKCIHCYIIRLGIHLDLVATTALIDMYSKCNNINQARSVFDGMKRRDVILFNVMITGYLQSGFADKAIKTFYVMVEAGIRPNPATFLSILSAYADLMDIREGRWVHGYIVRFGFESNIEIVNQVLYMYAKCGCIDIARQVFDGITSRDLVSWTSMMMGYVHHGHADEGVALFRLMQLECVEPDSITLISLVQAFSQLGCLKPTREVQGHVYRIELEKEIPLINSLVTSYAKFGRLDMAKALFEHSIGRDLASWNTMIAAYGMHGYCIEALELFDRMQEKKIKPNELTFTSLLSACSHAGLVEVGQQIFHSMVSKHSMVPSEEHYSCMVDLLGRAGRLKEAYNLVKCLPSRESVSALAALLSACRVHRNTEMGEIVGRQLLQLEPENSGAYTLLSNIYAEAGKWNEMARLRVIAKERGLRKQPGYSMIELDQQGCGM